jgi:hypothetical protein
MDYVCLLSFRPNATAAERDGALARRAGWKYPDAIRLIAEYWPMSGSPEVVSILSTDDVGALMEMLFEWNDVFEINITPAVSADEGLHRGQEVFGKIARMRG